MFFPQNNSGHGNGSEMVSPFTEMIKTYENARSNKSVTETEMVQTQKLSRLGSLFNLLPRRRKSNKVADARA